MKKTSRRTFGKQLTWAVGSLPVASLTVPSMAGPQGRRKVDGDTPITVGGGGGSRPPDRKKPMDDVYAYVEFDHQHFPDSTPSQDDKYYENSGEMANYVVFNDGLGTKKNLTRYLGDGDIKLSFAHSSSVTITQNPFGVKFKLSKYPQQGNGEHHGNDPVLSKITFEHKSLTPTVGSGWYVCVSKDPQGGDCPV